jgi:hypothetical protein
MPLQAIARINGHLRLPRAKIKCIVPRSQTVAAAANATIT